MTYKRELETFTETSYARALRSWSVCHVVQSRDDRGGRGFTDVTGVFSSARELVCGFAAQSGRFRPASPWSLSPFRLCCRPPPAAQKILRSETSGETRSGSVPGVTSLTTGVP